MRSLPAVISPEQLQSLINEPLDGLLILDLCQSDTFNNKCIESAVHISPNQLTFGEKPITGLLPPLKQLEVLFRKIGLTKETQVIVYDDADSTWAARMIWTLDIIGHTNASLLDGGISHWQACGFELSDHYRKPKPSTINISIDSSQIADKHFILDALNHNQLKIWDARSFDEFKGSKSLAKRSGHIPGATHYEWKRLLDEGGRIRDIEQIRSELASLGLCPQKSVVTHCQTHRRSALTYFVAKKLLAFNSIKAYPGSWAEWGNADDTPIAQFE